MNVNNIDDRWNMVGNLMNTCGSEEEKLAWGLCRGDSAEWKMELEKLEHQKAELMEFISSKLSEAWSKMGDTGSSDYMSKLNDENYWFGYFSALDNAQDILNKYKQQEERDE